MLVFTYIYVKQFSLIGGRRSRSGALSIGTPRRRGKERPPQDIVSEESEETSSSDGEDPDYGHDEIGFSHIPDAPEPTQDTPRPKRRTRARARDHTDVGSANVLATKPGRPRRPKKPFTPHASHD